MSVNDRDFSKVQTNFTDEEWQEMVGYANASPAQTVARESFVRPTWWNNDFTGAYADHCRSVIKRFVLGNFAGTSSSKTNSIRHTYTTRKNGTELWLFKNNPSIKVHVCVAKKTNGFVFGNSSSLFFMRQPKSGKIVSTRGRLKIQEVMGECIPMVPFQMLKESQLDINSMTLIDRGPDEHVDGGRTSEGKSVLTHFTGAMVFKIDVNKRSREVQGKSDKYFLFDIDRNDLKLKNLNFFLSALSRPVKSLKDAYDSLKPDEVREAEMFLGHEVQRQGEWFFIPWSKQDFKPKTEQDRWNRGRPARVQATLQAKGNRPHYVDMMSEEGFVKGKVTHGGYEHKPIELKVWCKAVPNTAIESFKISGSID